MQFSKAEIDRYKRHLVLHDVGGQGQQKLKAARVLIIGAGGLGSPIALYLAAAGVGTIGIIDDDTVSLDNLQRQVIHRTSDVGRPKVESAREAVGRLNPHARPATLNSSEHMPACAQSNDFHSKRYCTRIAVVTGFYPIGCVTRLSRQLQATPN